MLEPPAAVSSPLVSKRLQQAPLLLGVRRDDTALARRDLLVGIEGEDGRCSVRTDGRPPVPRPERLARVVDQRDLMTAADCLQPSPI